jgi:hydrogenase nickel incorporation protein HypA/HybF
MHELGIAHEIYRACRTAVEAQGGGRLEEAVVAVGELSALEPELLAFAWEAVTAGTADSASRLVVEWRPASQRCPGCGSEPEREARSWLALCPTCCGPLSIEGGRDLDLLRVSFEDADPVAAAPSAREP